MNVKETFDRNWRFLVFFVLSALVLWGLYTWRLTLLPFLTGLVLAYLLKPVVDWIQGILPGKGKWMEGKRVIAILIVFVLIIGIIGLLIFIAVTLIANNFSSLVTNASQTINNLIARGEEWTQAIRNRFPESMRANVDKVIQQIGNQIGATISNSLGGGGNFVARITSSVGVIFGFAALPIFLFYLLKDSDNIPNAIYHELPTNVAIHTRKIIQIIERELGAYIRAELILGTIVGTMTLIGLLIIRAPLPVPLAFFNGICEMVPTIGPIFGGLVMALITLAGGAPDKTVWVILLALIVQLLENNLLVPRIQAGFMHLHPSLVIFLLVLGGYFWGIWGVFLIVPLTATLVEIFKYVRAVNREANQRALADKTAE